MVLVFPDRAVFPEKAAEWPTGLVHPSARITTRGAEAKASAALSLFQANVTVMIHLH